MSLSVLTPKQVWRMPSDLAEIFEDDPQTGVDLLRCFLEEAEARLYDLKDAFRDAHEDDIHKLAHRLRGSCNQFGATSMALLVEEMEANPKLDLSENLEREFDIVQSAMQAWIEAHAASR